MTTRKPSRRKLLFGILMPPNSKTEAEYRALQPKTIRHPWRIHGRGINHTTKPTITPRVNPKHSASHPWYRTMKNNQQFIEAEQAGSNPS